MSDILPVSNPPTVFTGNIDNGRVAAQQMLARRYVTRIELCAYTTISRSSLYEKLDPKSPRYDPSFPRPVKLGKARIAFDLHAVELWLAQRIEQSQLPRN